jgi:hypothetical protein
MSEDQDLLAKIGQLAGERQYGQQPNDYSLKSLQVRSTNEKIKRSPSGHLAADHMHRRTILDIRIQDGRLIGGEALCDARQLIEIAPLSSITPSRLARIPLPLLVCLVIMTVR